MRGLNIIYSLKLRHTSRLTVTSLKSNNNRLKFRTLANSFVMTEVKCDGSRYVDSLQQKSNNVTMGPVSVTLTRKMRSKFRGRAQRRWPHQ